MKYIFGARFHDDGICRLESISSLADFGGMPEGKAIILVLHGREVPQSRREEVEFLHGVALRAAARLSAPLVQYAVDSVPLSTNTPDPWGVFTQMKSEMVE